MFSAIGTIALGAGLLVLALLCHKYKVLPQGRLWLYLLAGVCLASVAFTQLGVGLAHKIMGWAGPIAQRWIGIGAAGLAFVFGVALIFFLVRGLHPRKGKAEGWFGPLYFFAPALLFTFGSVFAELSGLMRDGLQSVVSTVGMG